MTGQTSSVAANGRDTFPQGGRQTNSVTAVGRDTFPGGGRLGRKPIEEIVMPRSPLLETRRITEAQRLKKEALVYTKAFIRDPITGLKSAAVRCICSACHETYYTAYQAGSECASCGYAPYGFRDESGKKIVHMDAAVCECCGAEVTAVWAARVKGGYVLERIYTSELRRIEGYAAFCGWMAEKSVDQDGVTKKQYMPWEAYIPEESKTGKIRIHRFAGHVRKMGGGQIIFYRFERRKKYSDEWGKSTITYAEPGCMEGTEIENSRWDAFCEIESFPVSYLAKWKDQRVLEAIIAEGGGRLIADAMKGMYGYTGFYSKEGIKQGKIEGIKPKETRPSAALGLTKDEWKICLKDGWSWEGLMLFRKAKQEGKGYRAEEQREIMETGENARELERLYDAVGKDFMKAVRYLLRPRKKKVSAGDYIDYLEMLRKVAEKTGGSEDGKRYPKDFWFTHDEEILRYTELTKQEENRGIREHAEKLKALCYEKGGLMIRPCESAADLVLEGEHLSHCVARYAESVGKGKTAIFFIRHSEKPEESYYTLEFNEVERRVVQNRGKKNCERTEEVIRFEAEWLERVKGMRRSADGVWSLPKAVAGE